MTESYEVGTARSQGLVDVLDRILDKGLVIAGDVCIRLADVELLTIQIRLLVCSADKAEELGMDWWRSDPHFSSSGARPALDDIANRLEALTHRLERLEDGRRGS
ncbi:MAG TPA: gas vesicle protein [Longimicrobiales bacterium]|nr:gas vesicle protein [Longimicrobiales bacterium]